MTRLGDNWNFLATDFNTTVAQMFDDCLGSSENNHFVSQTSEATFCATFGKTWLLFISTSGHTEEQQQQQAAAKATLERLSGQPSPLSTTIRPTHASQKMEIFGFTMFLPATFHQMPFN